MPNSPLCRTGARASLGTENLICAALKEKLEASWTATDSVVVRTGDEIKEQGKSLRTVHGFPYVVLHFLPFLFLFLPFLFRQIVVVSRRNIVRTNVLIILGPWWEVPPVGAESDRTCTLV